MTPSWVRLARPSPVAAAVAPDWALTQDTAWSHPPPAMPPVSLFPKRQDAGSPQLRVLVRQRPFSQAAERGPRWGVMEAQTSQTPPAEPLQSGDSPWVARTGLGLATKPPPPGEGALGALPHVLVLTCSRIPSLTHSTPTAASQGTSWLLPSGRPLQGDSLEGVWRWAHPPVWGAQEVDLGSGAGEVILGGRLFLKRLNLIAVFW